MSTDNPSPVTPNFSKTSIPNASIGKKDISFQNLFDDAVKPFVSEMAMGATDVGSDISNVVRSTWDLSAHLFETQTLAEGGPVALGMGVTGALGIFEGAFSAYKASVQRERALEIGDTQALTGANLNLTRSVVQTAQASASSSARGLSIASYMKRVKPEANAPSLLGRATYWTGFTSSLLSMAFFATFSVWMASSAAESAKFQRKLKKLLIPEKMEDPEHLKKIMEFFEKRVNTQSGDNPQKLEDKLKEKYAKDIKRQDFYSEEVFNRKVELAVQKGLYQDLCRSGGKILKQCAREMKIEGLDSIIEKMGTKELEDLFDELCADSMGLTALKKESRAHYLASFMKEQTHSLAEYKWQVKKDEKMTRLVGEKCFLAIKEAVSSTPASLKHRVVSLDPAESKQASQEVNSLVGKIQNVMNENQRIRKAFLVVGVIGAAATICSLVFGGALGVIAVAALFLVVSLGFFAIESYLLRESFKGETVGKYDKMLLAISSLICVVALAISVALFFTLGLVSPVALIMGGTICALWLGLNGYAYGKIHKKQKEYEIKHPSIDGLIKRLSSGEGDQSLIESFLRLNNVMHLALKPYFSEKKIHDRERIIHELKEIDRKSREEKKRHLAEIADQINRIWLNKRYS